MSLLNYIKKYTDFYLSNYSVTKKKFEDILKRKLKKDFFKKKITSETYELFLSQINEIVVYYNEIGLFNENQMIKNKIEFCIKKGYSIKKIHDILTKNKFPKDLISSELENLNENDILKEDLIKKFISKKIKSSKFRESSLSKSQLFEKLLSLLIQNGFEYENSKGALARYLSNEQF